MKKTYHFYYSDICKRDRMADNKRKPLYAIIEGRKVEYTHCTFRKIDGLVYAPGERYLGEGTIA